ncbi:MAG: DedA family protein, partial [Candidatus Saccharimonadales bacterium]
MHYLAHIQNIPSFIQALAPAINHYGYFALGGLLFLEDFGILVPGETVLIAAAFYAGLGQLNLPLVIIIGFAAAVLGDNIGYFIGRKGGRPLVERWGRYIFLSSERLDKAQSYFNNHGGKIVAAARFIEGLRQLNGIIAGISEMRWAKFLIFNVIGAAVWVSFWSLIAYYGSSYINTFLNVELYLTIAAVVLIASRIIY